MRFYLPFVLGCLLLAPSVFAQEETDLFELSLEELMNVEIVSASKKSENLFDAPVSSYTITRSEIARAGVTSIPEAMRLCPGVVVREITNGNYDVHLRGFDNLFRYADSHVQHNTITLLMIDDRPVFNHNNGGTIWESLPIDLIDVERIEIVRGPAAALFGPNAVTGVINIITRKTDKPGFYASSHLQYGTPGTLGANVAVGNKFSDKFDFIVSGNYQQRERSDDQYYVYGADQFFEDVTEIGVPFADVAYPEPELALEKYGINGFINYRPSEQVSVALATGLQGAEAQRSYYNFDITPLNTSTTDRKYVQLIGSFYSFGANVAYTSGRDNLYQGFGIMRPEYDVRNTDITLNYQWKISEKLNLRPEIGFQQAIIDDRDYTDAANGVVGFVNDKASNLTLAGSLKADYRPINALRLIGAVRVDKFEIPNRAYASYQLAATYKINEKYLLRAVHSSATGGAFLGNYQINIPMIPTSPTSVLNVQGNPNMDVTRNTMTELGIRVQAANSLQLDITVFQQKIKNLSNIYVVSEVPLTEEITLQNIRYLNLPMEAIQRGMTLSANFVPNQKVQVKPFVTLQETQVEGLPIGRDGTFSTLLGGEHKATPTVYGGAFINYLAHRKLNVNLNMYYFDQHTMYHRSDLVRLAATGETFNPEVGLIASKLLVNAKVTYQVIKKLDVYLNGRNLLGNNSREYYGTDRIGRMLLGGVSYNF